MAQKSAYIPRVVDAELDEALSDQVAVLIEGVQGIGKTETASQVANSRVVLDVDQEARAVAMIDPALVLAGAKPRLLDEWQEAPAIWDHVRRRVDAGDGPFILTGSAVPADDATRHSGAGRFSRIRMRPMTLFELGRSSGMVSLSGLLDGQPTTINAPELTVSDPVDITRVGGGARSRTAPVPEPSGSSMATSTLSLAPISVASTGSPAIPTRCGGSCDRSHATWVPRSP